MVVVALKFNILLTTSIFTIWDHYIYQSLGSGIAKGNTLYMPISLAETYSLLLGSPLESLATGMSCPVLGMSCRDWRYISNITLNLLNTLGLLVMIYIFCADLTLHLAME